MSDVFIENPDDADIPLNAALIAFTGCISEAFDDLCSCVLTYGDSYLPVLPDEDDEGCDEEEVLCSQAWVRVSDIAPSPNGIDAWGGDCSIELSVNLEVGVLRCVTIPEGGEAPTVSDALEAAVQANKDMQTILCAALNCDVWGSINVGQWQPSGPLGGQYGGVWSFTVTVD